MHGRAAWTRLPGLTGGAMKPSVSTEGTPNPMIHTYELIAIWLRARFADSERGASLVEYALLVALIALVCILAIRILGDRANSKFSSIGSGFN